MIETNCLVYLRNDLKDSAKDKHIATIELSDIDLIVDEQSGSMTRKIHNNSIIMFIDDLKTKILKNRFGFKGVILD